MFFSMSTTRETTSQSPVDSWERFTPRVVIPDDTSGKEIMNF